MTDSCIISSRKNWRITSFSNFKPAKISVHPAIFCLSSLLGILAIFSATCPNNIDGELVRVSGASGNNAGLLRNNVDFC